jgi:hypothetical protein
MPRNGFLARKVLVYSATVGLFWVLQTAVVFQCYGGSAWLPACRAEGREATSKGGDLRSTIRDLLTYQVDAHMGVNTIGGTNPIYAPVFRIEGSEVKFNGGDLRNTTIDLRKSNIEVFSVAEVLSETGQFGVGGQKHFIGAVIVDKNDRQVFFDQNWVYYPGSLRTVGGDGPFATVFVVCTRNGKPSEGVNVEMSGTTDKTGRNGWAELKLRNLKTRIVSAKISDPADGGIIEKRIPVPIVSAVPELVFYKVVHIELAQKVGKRGP